VLDTLLPKYPPRVENSLKALKRAVDHYLDERYAPALAAFPDTASANATAVADFFLLYRAKTNLALDRDEEALRDFRLLQKDHPQSSQLHEAILGECQAWLKLHDPRAALAVLNNPGLEQSAEILYFHGRAQEDAGMRQGAIDLYLRVYTDFVASETAALALERLMALAPEAVSPAANFKPLLRRAENLIRSGKNAEARAQLLKLNAVPAPDRSSVEKLNLLRGQTEHNLGHSRAALSHLQSVKDDNGSLHAQSLYFQALAYRRLQEEASFLAIRDLALERYPQSSFTEKILHSVATYFDVKNQPARADQAYRTIAGNFPTGEHAERARWKIALFAYTEGRYAEALHAFWNSLFTYPEADSAGATIYWMGRCYERLGDRGHAAYLYRRARALSNNSYYGRRAAEAENGLKKQKPSAPQDYQGISFDQVSRTLDGLSLTETSIQEPPMPVTRLIERARQLVVADLPDLALTELRSAMRRFPEERALSFVMSRVHESKQDFYSVIVTLRRAFPNYDVRPHEALPDEVWRLFFPVRHWEVISAQARKNGLDPALILGVIRQESAFKEEARSPANARGLMQVLPTTGRQLAREAKIPRYSTPKLFRAETNIVLGTRHLAALLRQFGHREELALAAYNAGENRVDRWLQELGNVDMVEFVERIPFSETRGYVKQVLTGKSHYRVLSAAARNNP
jgi:soluble lytic murein transglycosylase